MRTWVLLSVLATCASVCVARSTGPPLTSPDNIDRVCNAMIPDPQSQHGLGAAGDGGYRLNIDPPMNETAVGFAFTNGTVYTIQLVGTTSTINGFLVQARAPGGAPTLGVTPMLLGSFQPGSGHQTYDCDGAGVADQATITHSQNQNRASSVQFTWTAPSPSGVVDFHYTVMRAFNTHYDAIRAHDVGLLGSVPPTQPQTTPPPGNPTPPVRSPDNYRLQVFSPDGCSRSSCDLFIGIDTNTGDPGFLDIYMEGTAQGWLAVGFSETPNMFNADVVGCNRDSGGMVEGIDSWNPGARTSTRDAIQDVTLYSGTFSNQRLSCTMSKRISPSGSGEDLDLSRNLYVIWARRVPVGTPGGLTTHTIGQDSRGVSERRVCVSSDGGPISRDVFTTVHRPNLIRTHGILMVIAWPLLAISGIFFASFMKPALPNGEWFQVHRAFLLASLFIGALAFVLIFVALSNTNGLVDTSSGCSLAHMIMGIIIMALHIANPIVAIFRCKPNEQNRWIFNLIHYIIGFTAQGLSFSNVAIGLSIFTRTISQTFSGSHAPLWVMVAWIILYAVIVLVAFITFSVYPHITKQSNCASPGVVSSVMSKEKEAIQMNTVGGDKAPVEKEKEPERKPPSKDAPLRWGFLAVYLAVTVPILFAVIIMIAVP